MTDTHYPMTNQFFNELTKSVLTMNEHAVMAAYQVN